MIGERALLHVCIFAAGFAAAVIVGARNGHDLADREQEMVDACDAIARDDAARCMDYCRAGLELHASALRALGDRCVLSVPLTDNLRVARMPQEVMP